MKLRAHLCFAWWVRPLIWLACFNASLGIPVDPRRVSEIAARGMRVEIV